MRLFVKMVVEGRILVGWIWELELRGSHGLEKSDRGAELR